MFNILVIFVVADHSFPVLIVLIYYTSSYVVCIVELHHNEGGGGSSCLLHEYINPTVPLLVPLHFTFTDIERPKSVTKVGNHHISLRWGGGA